MSVRVLHGDMLAVLPTLEAESISAVVTDPPYELGFMGKSWDKSGIAFSVETWRQVLRVMKPGAHLAAFGASRNYHRMACAIEDAGFEIRDSLMWLYASGFPKSHDISVAIDKAAGAVREVVGPRVRLGDKKPYATNATSQIYGVDNGHGGWRPDQTSPATPEAAQWAGWGSALKPAYEMVSIARKPLSISQEWVTISDLLFQLWGRLWSMLPASAAAEYSMLSPSVYGVDASAFAQWTAEHASNIRADLSGLMDTSQFVLALTSSLSTVSSWSATLAEAWNGGSTSTTETASSTTIDLKTLKCCLSEITPANIIQAHRSAVWQTADASLATRYFSASVASLRATHELSALAPVISKAPLGFRGAGVSPLFEPILLARKPLSGTLAANTLKHGVGGIHIDACRVESAPGDNPVKWDTPRGGIWSTDSTATGSLIENAAGRWPANVLHDGSPEVMAAFAAFGDHRDGGGKDSRGNTHLAFSQDAPRKAVRNDIHTGHGNATGSAARFFFCGKADAEDRAGSKHPTVKPLSLITWLVRLITPPGGTVLDPFAGSGTTLLAADRLQLNAIGIEQSAEYVADIHRRLRSDAPLFADAAQ